MTVCASAADAHRRQAQARNVRAGRQQSVRVRVGLLAWLYLSAPIDVQRRMEAEMGSEVCDALVDVHDHPRAVAV